MAAGLRKLATLGRMLLPLGVYELRRRMMAGQRVPIRVRETIAGNAAVRDRHRGERCFIVANGPSARHVDLERLKGETVISVSNGYLHKGFNVFAPRYHCLPQITYGRMTPDYTVQWFHEMHERLGDAELFLSTQELDLVAEHGLFPGRTVRYLHFLESFDELSGTDVIDIAKPVPRVESVPLMTLMIAMYMGFREIVLLGVDHDHFLTEEYTYAFEVERQKGKDITVSDTGKVLLSRHDDFQVLARLWRQYRRMALIAKANSVTIYNATPGGALDEFERVPFEDVLRS